MTRWFTADLHLGHANIIDYCDRPFRKPNGDPDVPFQTEAIVQGWNDRVAPDDIVFCLGDMVMGRRDETLLNLARLNGHKMLVMGNHDYCWPHQFKGEKLARWEAAYVPYFDQGMTTEAAYTIPDGPHVRLHHFPYAGDSHEEDRYSEHRPVDDGTPLLHGHVHDSWKTKLSDKGTPMINVGVDVHGFAPVSEDEILEILREMTQ